jgi:hypothetical protein
LAMNCAKIPLVPRPLARPAKRRGHALPWSSFGWRAPRSRDGSSLPFSWGERGERLQSFET